ncbi:MULTISPECIES: hypothetical protein [Micromonospora]|uniref:hypothetical protein n=1 Tax=Micromonospora TaxID=1873 RepID=UPI0003EEB694|nr:MULTISPECIES: hypothetical protein [Micromonospora]EWM63192.1 LigA protein [Micromonospora sp. M42]MCK1805423.1 hypothetical protein [Micromonospora sp. R42106]MCK1835648.1 hypothetical protein [Micromonospora sp. R42003]MCK1843550.1 hypothetical protein [Micromonospora sp. R42004]MCM1014839.1 hypothetical protein [Micromonospora sp. XM-20-01]
MARGTRKTAVLKLGGVGALAALLFAGGLQLASAGENNRPATTAAAQTVNCPTVRDKLPAIPAAASAQVERELANLDQEIARQNERLARQAVRPEGGPAFIDNAILGPLRSKRVAVLDRIEIAFNRIGAPRPDLDALAACSLNAPGVPSAVNGGAGQNAGGQNGNAGGQNGNAGGQNGNNGGQNGNAAGPARTVNCPRVALPAVPAAAAGQVQAELATLDKQIAEANARLAQLAVRPEGGPAFIDNAILGPLRSKRVAALDRIEIAFNRVGAQRPNLDALATCGLN